ncbi:MULTISPECIES: pentapeptide repeat-containing protein [unclassified Enterococcus]|uniref:pentapeptide repeat-containing protein n=1 Tax=unclassified Enterococcus TaxID=2608891 RepID=UPI001CE08E2B|nr:MULTISPECIES: pentapeptide repeat-containing protein [unclassified Enterococcus]MCA5012332.1 pentapeptide repeat-containing protein [Enterococcus sp. S23]MCA5015583.1 pentapeptide repeat-containing protein [Enterococcus sp. S22(2020)]
MKIKKPTAPILPQLTQTEFISLDDEIIIEGLALKEQDLSYQDLRNLVFRECHFDKLTMNRNHLERFECSNVIFEHCDFSNTEWLGASFHQVHFRRCKLTGTNFAESYLRDCTFEDCLADYASFSATNQKVVHFNQTSLNDTEFVEVVWNNLLFEECSLTGSNWFHTKLKELDLRKSTFEKIAFSQELIKGLKVTTEQAVIIAAGLGLSIE